MPQFYNFSKDFAQPRLESMESPLILIHASSRSNLRENLSIAADLNFAINQLFYDACQNMESRGLNSTTGSLSLPYPASFYIMQRSYPSQAIKAAAAEGTQFIISLETRSDSSQPDRCGQAISFATSAGQLLAAYLQQGIQILEFFYFAIPLYSYTTLPSNVLLFNSLM